MNSFPNTSPSPWSRAGARVYSLAPGIAVSVVIAVCAQYLSEHYGAPAMLMALLIGIAFHFLTEGGRCPEGINFTSKTVLRIGVALLGARISVEMLVGLGPRLISLVVAGVILTILFGLLGAKMLGRGWRFGLLTGGAVAICGASAAMAIAAILPKNEHSERNLIFTVLSVTVLSTIAMIAYPIIAAWLNLNDLAAGVFLGGTIHDVAQVIGAGFSVNEQTGETAALVKLIRVTMLAPVVLLFALVIRAYTNAKPEKNGQHPPLIPFFVLMFLAFATINSFGLLPPLAQVLLADISKWSLLVSIAAVGMKTSLKTVFDVGGQAIVLIVAQTVFIASFILYGLAHISH
ncbi:putative sulfate exporter family transporter [Rhodobacteraceae bacterium F11138]|nr:putative sulfate exporter family transporter [Rhodobacteraceae bacterium F11138]